MEYCLSMVCCEGEFVVAPVLNWFCRGVRPTTVDEFLRRYWTTELEAVQFCRWIDGGRETRGWMGHCTMCKRLWYVHVHHCLSIH